MSQDDTRLPGKARMVTTCLAHLQAEEQALEQLEIVLHRNRQALNERDTPTLVAVGDQLLAHRNTSAALTQRRNQLRQSLSTWLGMVPEYVTISRLADRLEDEARVRIQEVQQRLRERVLRVNRLLQGNAMIAVQHNLIVGHTLATLTGQVESKRYGASGQLQDRRALSLFEAEL